MEGKIAHPDLIDVREAKGEADSVRMAGTLDLL